VVPTLSGMRVRPARGGMTHWLRLLIKLLSHGYSPTMQWHEYAWKEDPELGQLRATGSDRTKMGSAARIGDI
jgi:hypothetical protein